jgi:hypothetical protein
VSRVNDVAVFLVLLVGERGSVLGGPAGGESSVGEGAAGGESGYSP